MPACSMAYALARAASAWPRGLVAASEHGAAASPARDGRAGGRQAAASSAKQPSLPPSAMLSLLFASDRVYPFLMTPQGLGTAPTDDRPTDRAQGLMSRAQHDAFQPDFALSLMYVQL